MPSKIAVVYLARLAEGFSAFEAFAETYRRFPAGQPHDLIIVCKGFKKPGEFAAVDAIFKGIEYSVISVSDEIGLDIHAYREAAQRIGNDYIVCLNTFSNLRSENWLSKLWANMSKPGVGMVGATGSFESLYSSFKIIEFFVWALGRPIRYNRRLNRDFLWLLRIVDQYTFRQMTSKRLRFRRMVGDLIKNRPPISKLFRHVPEVWARAISQDGVHRHLRDIPQFPNPHLRSNAFMVKRSDLLATSLPDKSKIACCHFESGVNGLSISLLNRGLDLLVVGADGVGYAVDQWPSCGAFRSGDQSNLLVSDNQTVAFERFTKHEKQTNLIMTWGAYGSESNRELFGVSFDRKLLLRERIKDLAPTPKVTHERFISVAIPTHNRLDLVLDAIKTVSNQNYKNWEIVVFDNCSREPIASTINSLGDKRIRVERSEQFLPVTASWNRAINMTKGEYVVMIGDDDGLAPGYFERINHLADRFDNPDLVFSNLYQFMHPGVVPGRRQGYVAGLQMADFLDGDCAFVVDSDTIKRSVDNSLRMRRSFMFNMPAFCTSRTLLERLRIEGQVLHSPFPDYYFANIALERADSVVAEPRPIAFQGVSKVSFGFNFLNSNADEGFKALNYDGEKDPLHEEVSKHLLPGSRYFSEYIVTMAYVAKALEDGRKPDFKNYRKIQVWQNLKHQSSFFNWVKDGEGKKIWNRLSFEEKFWAFKNSFLYRLAAKFPRYLEFIGKNIDLSANYKLQETYQPIYRLGDHVNLSDVYLELEHGTFAPDPRPSKPDNHVEALRAV